MSSDRQTSQFNYLLPGLGILLVVSGHSYPASMKELDVAAALHTSSAVLYCCLQWIYTFHMPLFFFLAGINYLRYTAPKKPAYGQFVGAKARRLLAPYLVLTAITFPLKALLDRYALRPEPFRWEAYLDAFIVPWHNPIIFLWFLPTLFLVFCAAPALLTSLATRFQTVVMALGTALLFLLYPYRAEDGLRWFNVAGALHFLVFVYAGMVFEKYGWERKVSPWFVPLGILSLALLFHGPPPSSAEKLLLGFLGIACIYGVASILARRPSSLTRTIDFIGRYSFQIYLLSWFPQMAARIGLSSILHWPVWVAMAGMFLSGLLVPIVVTRILDAWTPKRLQFLYGK